MSLLELHNISKSHNNLAILQDVTFTVLPSSITTLIGPNGAGKTSLAKILLGIDKPNSGEIRRRPGLSYAYAPQKIQLSNELPITVEDFLTKLTSTTRRCAKLTKKICDFTQIESIAHLPMHALSGGQLQKTILAFALLSDADIVVLDEPLQYLDINSQTAFYSLIEEIRAETHTAFFIISHDLVTVMRSADQILCLNHHICCSGTAKFDVSTLEENNKFSHIGIYTHHHDHTH